MNNIYNTDIQNSLILLVVGSTRNTIR